MTTALRQWVLERAVAIACQKIYGPAIGVVGGRGHQQIDFPIAIKIYGLDIRHGTRGNGHCCEGRRKSS